MSSHREAPEIAKDPVADSTDVYAFVSPDQPGTVTLIANYVPLEGPDGGPNFYEFGDDVLYEIHVDNDGNGLADVTYQFRFTNHVTNPNTFLYNTGPIRSLTDPSWNRRQTYSVTRVNSSGASQQIASDVACPPCNIGPLSTPEYEDLVDEAMTRIAPRTRVFAGQRAEGFYVDLGAIFDLGDLRPFEQAHNMFGLEDTGLGQMAKGVNSTAGVNVHSIAIQVPIDQLTANSSQPRSVTDPAAVIGVWTTASRQKVRMFESSPGVNFNSGPFVQVSRLGNPLFNEVIVPMATKDYWNSQAPAGDSQFASNVAHPELAGLLPVLYPGVFPNLAAQVKSGAPRADLLAILLTGIPTGIVPGFQNYTGTTQADMLRLNVAIPPTTSGASNLGLIGGDPAGYPNGRRVFDDVATIEVRAIAGATLPLVDKSFTPDAAAGAVSMGLTSGPTDLSA
ncbi:MAG TPA: DUF4331 domain-containing protein, partial [Acidimicrobiales bacterium]|nr:DUF4331 domain-containing protein [Acidimicrobiales bacterium]